MELTGKTTEAGCPIPCSILSAASRSGRGFGRTLFFGVPHHGSRCSVLCCCGGADGPAVWITWIRRSMPFGGGGIMEQVHRVVLSHLDYDGQEKILEVGCGSGALIIRAALTWSKAKVIGIDYWGAVYTYSKALCEKNAASEGVASRCVFQHGDAKQLDFPDESFDVVISNYVYHNVMGADMQKLLLESLRVLKKGGVFALNDDMKPKMYGDMEGFAQKLRDMGYEEVRLVDIAQEAFGSHRRAAMMMLGSSRLLVGRK